MPERDADTTARDRPVPELLRELSDETTTLVRKEVALAKVELNEKARRLATGAGMFGGAAVLGVVGFGALTACIIVALATAVAAWLAALIVAVVYGAIAAVLALRGRTQVEQATPPIPEQAVDSAKEDLEWVRTRAKSARAS